MEKGRNGEQTALPSLCFARASPYIGCSLTPRSSPDPMPSTPSPRQQTALDFLPDPSQTQLCLEPSRSGLTSPCYQPFCFGVQRKLSETSRSCQEHRPREEGWSEHSVSSP
ncbi:hypothetical protein KIL84_001115 [Mauremys mutica]|uniref:Uncharacterized protein n=1 Tax=Mauremys mutica TaxID=74926 RepID=A0A9D4AVJ9_9SAUR|nr:hypothetical protein KIL84_001115 [Mauremys mutica]